MPAVPLDALAALAGQPAAPLLAGLDAGTLGWPEGDALAEAGLVLGRHAQLTGQAKLGGQRNACVVTAGRQKALYTLTLRGTDGRLAIGPECSANQANCLLEGERRVLEVGRAA